MEKSKVYAEADATTLMEAGIWTRMTSPRRTGRSSTTTTRRTIITRTIWRGMIKSPKKEAAEHLLSGFVVYWRQ